MSTTQEGAGRISRGVFAHNKDLQQSYLQLINEMRRKKAFVFHFFRIKKRFNGTGIARYIPSTVTIVIREAVPGIYQWGYSLQKISGNSVDSPNRPLGNVIAFRRAVSNEDGWVYDDPIRALKTAMRAVMIKGDFCYAVPCDKIIEDCKEFPEFADNFLTYARVRVDRAYAKGRTKQAQNEGSGASGCRV